jgi:hypothetical protein
VTINERAAELRRLIDEYDNGAVSEDAQIELAATMPIIEAAEALLKTLDVVAPLDRFLDMVEQMNMGPLNHLTCTEVNALAGLMAAGRGDEQGMWVIIHHIVDGDDEEADELRQHLEDWPELSATLRRVLSDEDDEILELLNEVEKEINQ